MKVRINIEKIEIEGNAMDFSFHNQLRIKKIFERELTRLILQDKYSRSFVDGKRRYNGFSSEKYGIMNYIKEVDAGQFSYSAADRNPSQAGRSLAKSIYSGLNLMK